MLQNLVQQIEETARSVMNELHTALPGKVVSIDFGTGMASIKPCGKYITSSGKKLEYPVLTEVPLVFPFSQSAGAGMAFPVKAGDGCLVIISETALDEWRSGAEAEAPLRYDLTNAMAIPGLLSAGGSLVAEACAQNSVIICGNLVVKGDITSKGSITGEVLNGYIAE